jgi:hypothetical protein
VSPQSLSDVSEELLELEEADQPEVGEFVDDAFEADERERRRVACTCSGASADPREVVERAQRVASAGALVSCQRPLETANLCPRQSPVRQGGLIGILTESSLTAGVVHRQWANRLELPAIPVAHAGVALAAASRAQRGSRGPLPTCAPTTTAVSGGFGGISCMVEN